MQAWLYNEGEVTHIGAGHSGEITGVKISPDGRYIVSVSDDGAIMRWKFPVSNEETATPIVPALDLPAQSVTPRQDTANSKQESISSPKPETISSPKPESVVAVSPKQGEEVEVGRVSSGQEPEEVEVGGATPKQEE